jgi:hypothetical protein
MPGDVGRLDDLVACKLCYALTTREDRALHLDWHARLNARVLAFPNKVVSSSEPIQKDNAMGDRQIDDGETR